MKITLIKESIHQLQIDLLVVGIRDKKPERDPTINKLDRAMRGELLKYIKEEDFSAKEGHTLHFLARGKVKARHIMLVGLGEDSERVQESHARLLGVKAGRAAQNRSSVAVVAPSLEKSILCSLADGIITGTYQYTRYLTGSRKPKVKLRKALILLESEVGIGSQKVVNQGVQVGNAINLVRDLVNCPANDLSPIDLAQISAEQCAKLGIECKVYDKKAIQKLGMPLLLAVSQGSNREPRLIHIIHRPVHKEKSSPTVVFVGKGLTFDSGGLCLKPPGSMVDMKEDMAGAAVTIGILLASARLKLNIEVHGIIAATDNSIGPDAYRPGDVLPSRDGKFIEVINTDAEGRMVLADALTYARELKPTAIIDHATLTGACEVALGSYTCGLFSNSDSFADKYLAASRNTGESYWRLPLHRDLKEQLKSRIADLKHTGSRYGSAITAALFLQEFIGSTPWIHLDIAGPAFLERQHGVLPKGGTGFGVLTAVRFLESLIAETEN